MAGLPVPKLTGVVTYVVCDNAACQYAGIVRSVAFQSVGLLTGLWTRPVVCCECQPEFSLRRCNADGSSTPS